MRILGLDVGDKRTGVAVSDPLKTIASALTTLITGDKKELAGMVKKICDEQEIEKIVVGYPLNMNGSKGERAIVVEEFCDYLKYRTQLSIELFDERLTTVQAQRTIHQSGKKLKKEKQHLDQIAAVILLQTYLNRK